MAKLRFGLSRTLWCAQQEWPVQTTEEAKNVNINQVYEFSSGYYLRKFKLFLMS